MTANSRPFSFPTKANEYQRTANESLSLVFLVFGTIKAKGSEFMRNWIDRLIKCGIPEKQASKIINFFFKQRRTIELIAYVRMTEEATGNRGD